VVGLSTISDGEGTIDRIMAEAEQIIRRRLMGFLTRVEPSKAMKVEASCSRRFRERQHPDFSKQITGQAKRMVLNRRKGENMGIKFGFVAACVVTSLLASPTLAADEPGVTATEIKIGGIFPFSGPASSIGLVGKGVVAYVQSINDRGGINGRKINYIAMDDAYSPPKAVEHARKLVESDEVSFIFGQLGTPGNSATAKYLKGKGVPSIAIVSGSSKFTDAAEYPLTTTGLVSYQTEGRIYAKFLDKALPGAKYAILFQNDDLGKDYVGAFKSFLKTEFDKRVVTAAYEVTEPTVDSQVVNLKSSGAEALFIAGTPKFAAQAIRKAANRLEGQDHHQLPVGFDQRHAETCRTGEFRRRHRRHHQQGSDRCEVERRRGRTGLQGVLCQIPAGR
jgi:ABC-type branched-subunit amino acid transport system substrate-binding protein